MRVVAVIANLAQVGIVLAIFIRLGLDLGTWIILGLFCLLIIALLNQIVAFFFAVNKPVHHPLVAAANPAKRKDYRVSYAMAPQPTLIINGHPYSVVDLAENGVRFAMDSQEGLAKQFSGRISLLCGRSLPFTGSLVRRQQDEVAVIFNQPVDRTMLVRESNLIRAIR